MFNPKGKKKLDNSILETNTNYLLPYEPEEDNKENFQLDGDNPDYREFRMGSPEMFLPDDFFSDVE